MEIQTEEVRQDPVTGSREVVRTQESTLSQAVVQDQAVEKTNAVVWYIVGVILVLLALRLLFLLLGAGNTGFTALIYTITAPLVAPFRGIFASPGVDTGYFDTAALLAMVIYPLIGWGISSLMDVSRRGKVVA
ncbi:MAG: rane protein of unknown function [Patescibacteria group bacterium]|jgi:uncharacterized protein YggT (Ycf19 family)|nr:rane protein of unknown function [Patescibacteria group bacterium]